MESVVGSDATAQSAMFATLGLLTIATYIISAIFMGMVFKKAGVPAWKAWIPVYNAWVFLELGGQKGWISLLLLLSVVPLLGLIPAIIATVYMCIAAYKIGLSFGKEGWFVLLYIFVGPVWLIWLALDKSAVWQPSAAPSADATLAPETPDRPAAM